MLRRHEFWCRVQGSRELSHISVSLMLRFFAVSLISVFIPLYLYKELGYSFTQTLLFFIFYSIIFAIFTPLAASFAARFGVKHAVLFSLPFYVAFLILLSVLKTLPVPLVVLSTLMGISLAFYWMGMNLLFYQASDHSHRGEQVGKNSFYKITATVIAPVLGGFLITWFNFQVVFVLACMILMTSAIVLFLSKESHIKYHFSFRDVLSKDHWKNSIYFSSKGTEAMATGVLWPLFIFTILGSYFTLGIAGAVMGGGSAVLMWVAGRYSDHKDKAHLVHVLTLFECVSWIASGLVATPFHVFAVSALAALVTGVRQPPLEAMEFDKARGHAVSYFVSREIFICLGRIFILVFVLMINNVQGGIFFHSLMSLTTFLF